MDLTQEQIEQEFSRQVRLCSGIGYERMIEIVKAAAGAPGVVQLSDVSPDADTDDPDYGL